MTVMKLAMAGLLGMATVSALAQAPSMGTRAGVQAGLLNGDRDSLSRSNKASNIVPADTSGADAPTLPLPTLGLNAPSRDYLLAARASLAAGHTGEAQQSLEMAETRALGGSISPDQANLPTGSAIVAEIRNALHALGNGNRAKAIQIIDIALGS